MHCDVKPENIVRVRGSTTEFKLIDFGSCIFHGDAQIEYVQSRYYRAPEVVLRLPFDAKVDVWSLGCVAAELMLGLPLLPAARFCGITQRKCVIFARFFGWKFRGI